MIVLASFRKERMRIAFAKLYEILADIKIKGIGVTTVRSASGIPDMVWRHCWRKPNIPCLTIEAKDHTVMWRRGPSGDSPRRGRPDDQRSHHNRPFR